MGSRHNLIDAPKTLCNFLEKEHGKKLKMKFGKEQKEFVADCQSDRSMLSMTGGNNCQV